MKRLKFDLKNLVEYLFNAKLIKDHLVVGSLALEVCDVPLRRKPHDIDIEVVPEDLNKLLEAVTAMQSASHNTGLANHYGDGVKSPYVFKFGESIVNLWIVNEEEMEKRNFVYKDYVKYAGMMSVISYKKKYTRDKDALDALFIINHLSSFVGLKSLVDEHENEEK